MKRPRPRTDAQKIRIQDPWGGTRSVEVVPAEFAGNLEDEINALDNTIVTTVGGTCNEGTPTSKIDYLQRLRALVDKEERLKQLEIRIAALSEDLHQSSRQARATSDNGNPDSSKAAFQRGLELVYSRMAKQVKNLLAGKTQVNPRNLNRIRITVEHPDLEKARKVRRLLETLIVDCDMTTDEQDSFMKNERCNYLIR